jgi:hypothetical protein
MATDPELCFVAEEVSVDIDSLNHNPGTCRTVVNVEWVIQRGGQLMALDPW